MSRRQKQFSLDDQQSTTGRYLVYLLVEEDLVEEDLVSIPENMINRAEKLSKIQEIEQQLPIEYPRSKILSDM